MEFIFLTLFNDFTSTSTAPRLQVSLTPNILEIDSIASAKRMQDLINHSLISLDVGKEPDIYSNFAAALLDQLRELVDYKSSK